MNLTDVSHLVADRKGVHDRTLITEGVMRYIHSLLAVPAVGQSQTVESMQRSIARNARLSLAHFRKAGEWWTRQKRHRFHAFATIDKEGERTPVYLHMEVRLRMVIGLPDELPLPESYEIERIIREAKTMESARRSRRLVSLLKDLIALPSVNPSFGGTGEAAVADYVENFLRRAGLTPFRQSVFPGRDNIVARIGPDGPALLLEAHMDTVATEGWFSENPFDPVEKDGRIYGRGTCDTKASLAVFLAVAEFYARRPGHLKQPLLFAATVDEEEKQTGALRLVESGLEISAAITGEPTLLDIIHAHKGVLRFHIHATGTAAHSAFPERGQNAILRMAPVLERLAKYAADLAARPKHPTLGNGTLNPGVIRGGQAVNIVPDRCSLEIDRRLLPHETGPEALADIRALLADLPGISVEDPYLDRPGIDTPSDSPFANDLANAVRPIKPGFAFLSAPYMTNATAYAAAGIPSLVFGPGDIAQAHTRDEFIEIAQLESAFRILLDLAGNPGGN